MTDRLKTEIDKLKIEALAAFRGSVDRDELKAKIADSSCALLVDTDLTIFYATPPLERLFGYESEELEGEPVSRLIPQRFHEVHAARTPAYIAEPSRRTMSDRPDLAAIKRDGEEFRVRIELRPVKIRGARYFVAEVFEGGVGG